MTKYEIMVRRITGLQSKIAVMEDESAILHVALATLRAAAKPFADRKRDRWVADEAMVSVYAKDCRVAAEAMESTSEEEVQPERKLEGLQRQYRMLRAELSTTTAELAAKASDCCELDYLYANSLKTIREMRAELNARKQAEPVDHRVLGAARAFLGQPERLCVCDELSGFDRPCTLCRLRSAVESIPVHRQWA